MVGGWLGQEECKQLLIEPFVNYNLPNHWYLVSGPIMTANWAAKAGDIWTVPLGGGVGKLFRLGQILPLEGHEIAKLPINTQMEVFGNVARPELARSGSCVFKSRSFFRSRSIERMEIECFG